MFQLLALFITFEMLGVKALDFLKKLDKLAKNKNIDVFVARIFIVVFDQQIVGGNFPFSLHNTQCVNMKLA